MTMNKQNYNISSVFKNISVLHLFCLKITFVLKMATLDYNSGLNITIFSISETISLTVLQENLLIVTKKKNCCSHTDDATTDQRGRSYASVPGNG